jgi:hypothetical protein
MCSMHTSIGGHFANAMSKMFGHKDIAARVHGYAMRKIEAGLLPRSVGVCALSAIQPSCESSHLCS